MKKLEISLEVERLMLMNEASLIDYLDIDEIDKCLEVYEHNNCLYVVLEWMDQRSMSDFLARFHKKYSEDFKR